LNQNNAQAENAKQRSKRKRLDDAKILSMADHGGNGPEDQAQDDG
jgi:hypothetical protein